MSEATPELPSRPFKPLRLILAVILILLGISLAAQWYAGNVTLPRYCDDPQTTLANVKKLLNNPRPAGDGERKPYILAARLIFLLPQQDHEDQAAYLGRLAQHISEQCSSSY